MGAITYPTGTRVRFRDGFENGGKTGVVESIIPMRYRAEETVYRVRLDGQSGSLGLVYGYDRTLEREKSMLHVGKSDTGGDVFKVKKGFADGWVLRGSDGRYWEGNSWTSASMRAEYFSSKAEAEAVNRRDGLKAKPVYMEDGEPAAQGSMF